MPAGESSFAGKFLRNIKKIDTDQIEAFLSQVLREKAFLEVIFDSITEGIVVTEQDMRVVFLNDAARQFLSLGNREAIGEPLMELFPAEEFRPVAEEFQLRGRPIRQRQVTLRQKMPRVFALTVVPIENEEGLATHSVWIVGDRTEALRRAEEARQMHNIESLAALTAGVAHEVKNPLNSLNIHAQLAAKGLRELRRYVPEGSPEFERTEKSLQIILDENQRLARVVDGFRDAVRPVRPELKKESLEEVLVGVAELIAPECQERGIELVLNLDPETPNVLIDRKQVQQALLNIVKNAMEAIDEKEGRVVLRTLLKSDHVLIEVEDNGCGISEEERLRIFEPYHTTKFGGMGLGLMVVYRIVRAHRGAIGLNSQPGQGTIFSIALPVDERPVRMLEAQVDPPLEEPLAEPSEGARKGGEPSRRGQDGSSG